MVVSLTTGALEAIILGSKSVDNPVLQVLSFKKITAAGSSNDRYRLLLSDGQSSYSHAMLATQLNSLMEDNIMDNLSIIKVDRYMCNTINGDRKIMILLDVNVLQKGSDVQEKIGAPQPLKSSGGTAQEQSTNSSATSIQQTKENQHSSMNVTTNQPPKPVMKTSPTNPYRKAGGNMGGNQFSVKGSSTPGTPGSNKVHSIASLTPYQNRWRIRARITMKSAIKTWSNSRGEGKLFSVHLLDETGEIRATGFTDAVDKFYDMLEVNKVYYISKGTIKTANKQYSTLNNDYEMTFNSDTTIELCQEDVDLPSLTFEFVKFNELDHKQPNAIIDVIGIVKSYGDIGTVIGKASQKEITKRDIQLVDQTGMVVNATLWGNDAQSFDGSGSPVMAVKGARLSDYGGRSLSVLANSQVIMSPDCRESHMLRGWFDREGKNMDFQSFKSDGMSGGGGGGNTNWKHFSQVKSENIGSGEKPDYFTSKGTVIFFRKENCMYKACPTDSCNKKLVDQGNGLFRCEKCSREFPNYKWRMILSANLADFSDNQWVTCFQDSAEALLGRPADELGKLRESNETEFDQVFAEALFKSYVFKMRAKVETYNDESRLKTVCMNAEPVNWKEHGRRLLDEINKMAS